MRRLTLNRILPLAGVAALLVPMLALGAPTMNDRTIRNAVAEEILDDPAIDLADVRVMVRDGDVTLTGTVGSLMAKERAARLARTVRGVENVINNVSVSPLTVPNDAKLAAEIDSALLVNPATESFEITPMASDGNVTLRGTVDSWAERELAGKVAASVTGVRSLTNEVDVALDTTRPTGEIASEVRERLRWDVLVDATNLNVDVSGDRVKLSGRVASAAEKARAARDARVAGVRDVDVRRLSVDPALKKATARPVALGSEQEVDEAVEALLTADPRVPAGRVSVESDEDGLIVLRGEVPDLQARRAAGAIARSVAGISDVRNRIDVRPPASLSDDELKDRLEGALARDPWLDADELDVEVDDHVAVLDGAVGTYFEKMQAENVLASTAGVRGVVNGLEVDTPQVVYYPDPWVDELGVFDYEWYVYEPTTTWRTDAAIAAEIEEELTWSPFVDADEVHVTVADGTARLTGTVDSWAERRSATENAFEGGAVWVDNDLSVRTDEDMIAGQ